MQTMLMQSLKDKFVRLARLGLDPIRLVYTPCFIAFACSLFLFQSRRARPCTEQKNGAHIDPYRRDDFMADCLFY